MLDQYFGAKELHEVVLRAKIPMQFGSRHLEAGEPVLYFDNVSLAALSERNSVIMARGGWSNLPQVIWEDRSEVRFTLSKGVMSSIGFGILLSAAVTEKNNGQPFLVPTREGPFELEDGRLWLKHTPVIKQPNNKVFIYEYERGLAQKKVYGKLDPEHNRYNDFLDETAICVKIFQDKEKKIDADVTKQYIIDYYYEYNDKALLYTIQKERFNGLFTLEGKFYSKDENDGLNYTNLIYMPKVRVVSDINLRLGERADPTTSVFEIIGLPENTIGNSKDLILEITRLSEDIDEE